MCSSGCLQVLASAFRLLSTSPTGTCLRQVHLEARGSAHPHPVYPSLSDAFASFFDFVESFPATPSETALGLGGLRLEEQRILRLLRRHPDQRLQDSPEYDYAIHDPLRKVEAFARRFDEEPTLEAGGGPSPEEVQRVVALLAEGGVGPAATLDFQSDPGLAACDSLL